MNHEVALYTFAYHPANWLENIHQSLKSEPWGKDYKVLELYLRYNFEIAKQQQKVFEDKDNKYAIWRAGYLMTPAMDPVWLYYEANSQPNKQKWYFKSIRVGEEPLPGINIDTCSIKYDPPEFNSKWDIYIDPTSFSHILSDRRERLQDILGKDATENPYRLFRTIYGEIMLEKKEAAGVIPQWYMGGYNFLMPLSLTKAGSIDLAAALTIDNIMKRYQLRTLLPLNYAYANARAIVKSNLGASWVRLDEAKLNTMNYDDQNDE